MVRESGISEIIEELQARREMYGFSYIVVQEPMEQVAPVVERWLLPLKRRGCQGIAAP